MSPLELLARLALVLSWTLLPVAAIAALTLAVAGQRFPTRPVCRRCRHRLAPGCFFRAEPCPGCGASVAEAGPPRPAGTRIAWRPLMIGVGCAALAALGTLFGRWWFVSPAGAATIAQMPTAALVATAWAAGSPYDMHLAELRRRLESGRLSAGELAASIVGQSLPVPAGSSVGPATVLAEILVERPTAVDASLREQLTQSALSSVLALSPSPPPFARGMPKEIRAQLFEGGSDPSAPLARRSLLRAVLVDGQPVTSTVDGVAPGPDPVPLPPFGVIRLADPLPDDDARVELEIEERLFDAFDSQRTTNASASLLPVADWPAAIGSRVVRVPLGSPRPVNQPAVPAPHPSADPPIPPAQP